MKKTITKITIGTLIGIAATLLFISHISPFSYQVNSDNSITFTIENEVVSDYETIERDETGTTFKVWFEKDGTK